MTKFKPMLACDADLSKLRFPLLASPKLDGIRCSIVGGKPLTRTLKGVPNTYIWNYLYGAPSGLDGELIVGAANAPDVYRTTVSGVMSHNGKPNFTYWVFDLHDVEVSYTHRLDRLLGRNFMGVDRIRVLPQIRLHDHDALLEYENELVNNGYEGVILRDPTAPYKYGRSTVGEGYLLKLKRFTDSEAVVLDVQEEMHNANEATVNELGRTKRSSAKAGKVGKGTMGALVVRDLKHGWEFSIGAGFTAADRARTDWVGRIVKYKYFPVGMLAAPRHPVYLGERSKLDL